MYIFINNLIVGHLIKLCYTNKEKTLYFYIDCVFKFRVVKGLVGVIRILISRHYRTLLPEIARTVIHYVFVSLLIQKRFPVVEAVTALRGGPRHLRSANREE